MNNLFVPFPLAKLAISKGFPPKECLKIITTENKVYPLEKSANFNYQEVTEAPLCQQLVEWFRKKHYITIEPITTFDENGTTTSRYRILQITYPHIKIKGAKFSYRDYKVETLSEAFEEAFKLI